jgi:hypothetical protein
MATTGTICIATWPLLPGAVSSPAPIGGGANTFAAPPGSGTLIIDGISVTVKPYQQAPQDMLLNMIDAGIKATLNLFGYLVLTNASPTVAGTAGILTALGLTAT